MRYGIFGGTFDPPHIGHLVLAAEAYHQLALECVLWVLTPQPPHKPDRIITSLSVRQDLLHAVIGQDTRFELSTVDIDRPPPHYAVDTVNLLRAEHPNRQYDYLMGADSLVDLPTWHKAPDFIQACDGLGVMRRPGKEVNLFSLESILPGVSAKVHFIEAPLLEISSSDIRARVNLGMPYRYFLPESVYDIVRSMELYQDDLGEDHIPGDFEEYLSNTDR